MTNEEFYTNILGLSDQRLIQELAEETNKVYFKAGQIIFSGGEICNDIFFLEEGLIRGVILDIQGRDITDCLIFRCGETLLASFDKLEKDIPATYSVEVLEDSSFFRIPMEKVIELKEKYAEVIQLYNQMLIESLEEHREIKLALYQFTAVDRYLWFLRKYPSLINRIPYKQIASYLGMTPVTLSRIRRNLRDSQGECDIKPT